MFHQAPRPVLTELELSRALDLAASVLGEPEPIMPMQRGGQTVPSGQRLNAVAVLADEANRGKLALFAGINDVRFKRMVLPGDELELTCELERMRGPVGRGKATATVDGELAARGTLMFAVTDA